MDNDGDDAIPINGKGIGFIMTSKGELKKRMIYMSPF
jgi:hypothetical protein